MKETGDDSVEKKFKENLFIYYEHYATNTQTTDFEKFQWLLCVFSKRKNTLRKDNSVDDDPRQHIWDIVKDGNHDNWNFDALEDKDLDYFASKTGDCAAHCLHLVQTLLKYNLIEEKDIALLEGKTKFKRNGDKYIGEEETIIKKDSVIKRKIEGIFKEEVEETHFALELTKPGIFVDATRAHVIFKNVPGNLDLVQELKFQQLNGNDQYIGTSKKNDNYFFVVTNKIETDVVKTLRTKVRESIRQYIEEIMQYENPRTLYKNYSCKFSKQEN